jgi:hypothetical protein
MQERIQNVVDAIDANPKAWDLSVRSTQTTDGRSLLSGEVTDQQTKTDAAMQMIKAADAATMSPHGLPIEVQPDVTLAQHLLKNRRAPTVPALSQIDAASLPEHVKGPEMIQVAHNALRELVERGFNNIGRFMDWLIREPMYLHNYAESREIPGFAQSLYQSADESGRQNLDELVQDLAHERAFEKTLPFIHDPQVRSQAATVMRNLIPFYFAQEQFFKRWARTFAFSPESFRKAQLAINGMRHMGIIHKDQQTGQEYFLYPAAGATQDVLIRAYEAVTGHKASLPIPANLRGEIQFLSPGTERLGLPSFGPMVAMPLDALSSRFPELEQAKQSILGQRGANPSRWEQIVPSTMSRLVHYAIDKPDTSAQLNSAMNQAIQYLDATGHGLPENASTEQLHQFLSRVENWARVLFLTRMVFGFNVPASPELQIDPSTLHEDYAQLLKELPYNKATQTFLGQHPDATAFTVFQSKSQSGAPLPATAAAESFLQSHMSFLKDYPMAGAWFIPQQDSKGQYDQAAYRIQLAEQLRTRKDPTTFYKDVVYAKDATAYFQAEDRKNTALRGAHGAEATAIRQTWSAESQAYLKAHPIFAEMLQSSDAKFQRTQALQQLTLALNDSRLPKSPQTDHIRTLIDGYNTYQAMYSQFHGLRTAAASHARRQLEVEFASEITQYVQENPDVEGIYNRVIRPDITTAISAMEAVTGVPAPVGI